MKSSFEAYIENPANDRLVKDILIGLQKRGHNIMLNYPISHNEKEIIVDALIDGNIALFKDDPYRTGLPDFIATVRSGDRLKEMYIGNFIDHPEIYQDMPHAEKENVVRTSCDMIEEVQKNHFNFTL